MASAENTRTYNTFTQHTHNTHNTHTQHTHTQTHTHKHTHTHTHTHMYNTHTVAPKSHSCVPSDIWRAGPPRSSWHIGGAQDTPPQNIPASTEITISINFKVLFDKGAWSAPPTWMRCITFLDFSLSEGTLPLSRVKMLFLAVPGTRHSFPSKAAYLSHVSCSLGVMSSLQFWSLAWAGFGATPPAPTPTAPLEMMSGTTEAGLVVVGRGSPKMLSSVECLRSSIRPHSRLAPLFIMETEAACMVTCVRASADERGEEGEGKAGEEGISEKASWNSLYERQRRNSESLLLSSKMVAAWLEKLHRVSMRAFWSCSELGTSDTM